jgi:geranylgeranyl reductase family protein
MKPTNDIIIVGGGPAGAYCALEMTKQGIYPLIFDHSHPREKPCGGGISPQTISKFEFIEKFRSKGFTFGDFNIISCTNMQVVTKELENGFCISRSLLDEGILKMATDGGAELIKEKVIEIENYGDHWKVKTNKRIISAKIVVGADGVNSIVRRKTIGPIPKQELALTFGYRATPVKKESATIKYLAEFPGYIWVFPGKGYSNVGIGGELKHGNKLKRLLDAFIESNYPDIKITSEYVSMLPSANNPKFFENPCMGKNWILVGDAAGHVDPISGGGILYALWGGKIAADVTKINALETYDYRWREEFGNTLIEHCKKKPFYYDPVESTLAMFVGLSNKTYSWPPSNS